MENIGIELCRFILEEENRFPEASGSLTLGLQALASATKIIGAQARMAGLVNILGKDGRTNYHDEEVQKLDVYANDILIQYLSDSGQFFALASEENEDIIYPENGKKGNYIIAFDPLDGSSNIDVNVSIGTIFSIHEKINGTEEDFYQKGSKQIAAGYVIYGSSTMFVFSTGSGVNGFTLDPSVGLFLLSHPNIKTPVTGEIYSINEGNTNSWRPEIKNYINSLKLKGKKSRYIGSMVSDVHRTLIKGGFFAYPADEKNTQGKLRLLYEASPMAFLCQEAGAKASTGKENILDLTPNHIHQTCPVFLGSSNEVDEMLELVSAD